MSKFRFNNNLLALASFTVLASSAHADWTTVCVGPSPRTAGGYGVEWIHNPLFEAVLGIGGTFAYSATTDTPPGCFNPGLIAPVSGRIGFGVGSVGTIQTDIDDNMSITWGWLGGVGGSSAYAIVREDATPTLFGANGFQTAFTGLSDNYCFARTTNNHVQVDLRIDMVADAARLSWKLTNIDTVSHTVGLGFGQTVALLSETLFDSRGTGPSFSGLGTYVTVPGNKPPQTERRFTKATDPSGYPSSVYFNWSQQFGVGLRVENSPNDATTDPNDPNSGQTSSDSFVLGQSFFLLGWPTLTDPTDFPNTIFEEPVSDVGFAGDDGYIQFWDEKLVAGGASRTINSYYRTTWGDSIYAKPYSAVVDTPKVINLASGDANQFAQNPFTVRVWVDNNRGFSQIDQSLFLQDVRVELLLPDGLTAVGPKTKTINSIAPRTLGFVDFTVQADDFAAGDLTYQVRITPTPGPVKTITGNIQVVSQPKLILRPDANLITSPWTFDQPVWETILGLTPDADYQAFVWDPLQKGYIVSTGPERGHATWIVSKVGTQNIVLGGNPQTPNDFVPIPPDGGGAPQIALKPGWNMIGNPYHVAFQLGEIVGASNTNPLQSYTYTQLVQQGLISGSLGYWDTGTQNYRFIQATTDKVEPQRGYWIYVFASQDVIIRFPPVFQVNVRGASEVAKPWQQTDKQWRLQLALSGKSSADSQNFIGVTTNAESAKSLRVYEPPMAPLKSALSLSIAKSIDGKDSRLAQSLSETKGRQEFDVKVESREAGPVTLTWPNLSTIPKNVRVTVVDVATGETRDLRKVSGYTFQADANSTRSLKVQLEPGVVSRAIIGNVVVSNNTDGRGVDTSIRMNYTLGSDATTTVRILSASGREVMTLSRGRADKAGQNEVVWNLKDQANRAVAPGTYRAEIIAEGQDGDRVRKITPLIVKR